MAIRKPTKKSTNPAASNPAGKNAIKISPAVTVLGKALLPGLSQSMTPRAPFTNAELARLRKLADKIKAVEIKAANDKKANAKIIKSQNKSAASKTILDKAAKKAALAKKKVIKVTPRGGRGGRGGGGGMLGGGGGALNDYNR